MNTISLHDAELRSFALCGFDSTQDYKRTAMYILLRMIQQNRSVSIPKLKFDMEKKYRIPQEHTDGVLRGLFSTDGLGVISIKQMRKEVATISSPVILETWLASTLKHLPELEGYSV